MPSPHKTPLSSTFPDSWQGCWDDLARPRFAEGWKRRLSWQTRDLHLAAFLDFLKSHGPMSELSDDEWKSAFHEHMKHQPNRFVLFHLLSRSSDFESVLASLDFPNGEEKAFLLWKKHWEKDQELTQSIRSLCNDEEVSRQSAYRGVPLSSSLTYTCLSLAVYEQRTRAAEK